jgi:hypothetical protein
MAFARWFGIITGLQFALYGAYCVYDPQLVAKLTAMTASSKALTELTAMYGGMEIGFGLFLIAMALKRQTLEACMLAIVLCCGGLCSTRGLSIVLHGGDDYNTPAVGYESLLFCLGLVGLLMVRKARSGVLATA